MKRSFAVCCVLFFALFIADQSEGHTLTVDVDAATPGIQATAAYLPGTLFMVDIILTSSGVAFPVIDSFQMDVQFNDTPGVITYGGLTLSGGGIGGLVGAGATDVVAGGPAPPGTPLAPLSPAGALAFGAGIAGGSGMAFTANDGGTGIYDIGGLPFVPGPAGTAHVILSLPFTATGPIGSSTDIGPFGLVFPGPPAAGTPLPVYNGAFGVGPVPGSPEFYDSVAGTPLPSLGIAPGFVSIIPEPGTSLLFLGGLGLLIGMHRRRR